MPGKEISNQTGETDRGNQTNDNNFNEEEDGADGDTENLLQPDKKISMNDFEPITVIGRGSFGKVYLVKKKDTMLPYAMKILKKDQLIKKICWSKLKVIKFIIHNIIAYSGKGYS